MNYHRILPVSLVVMGWVFCILPLMFCSARNSGATYE